MNHSKTTIVSVIVVIHVNISKFPRCSQHWFFFIFIFFFQHKDVSFVILVSLESIRKRLNIKFPKFKIKFSYLNYIDLCNLWFSIILGINYFFVTRNKSASKHKSLNCRSQIVLCLFFWKFSIVYCFEIPNSTLA